MRALEGAQRRKGERPEEAEATGSHSRTFSHRLTRVPKVLEINSSSLCALFENLADPINGRSRQIQSFCLSPPCP